MKNHAVHQNTPLLLRQGLLVHYDAAHACVTWAINISFRWPYGAFDIGIFVFFRRAFHVLEFQTTGYTSGRVDALGHWHLFSDYGGDGIEYDVSASSKRDYPLDGIFPIVVLFCMAVIKKHSLKSILNQK